ncbi:hypothetical protein [Anaerocolumna jejuensis]|uniref:hypothetical protein n=1 Tax=Anaerocolumna jejuensis TaxID=259063 RepID=UPI003F7C808D
MKLRYKKIIAMVTVCTMGIGMVTFSISRQGQDKSTAVEREAQNLNASYDTEESAKTADKPNAKAAVSAASLLPTDTPASDSEARDEASLLSAEKNPLEKNTNKEIDTLITKYLNAKLSGKIEKFEDLVDNTQLLDIKDISRKTKYIDKYENVESYIKKGLEEGSYVVYACYNLKLASIDTPAPGMNEYYIKTNKDGKFYVYLGEGDSKTDEFLSKLCDSSDVEDLIYKVNDKLKTALKKDASLSEFYTKLEDSAKNVSMNE